MGMGERKFVCVCSVICTYLVVELCKGSELEERRREREHGGGRERERERA